MVLPEGPVRCILCRGFVNINNKKRFEDHLTHEHRVYFHSDLLLGACKLNSVNTEDLSVVKRIIDGMFEENMNMMKVEESAGTVETDVSDSTINMSTSLDELSNETLTNEDAIMDEDEEKDKDAYATIPSHLLNEFQKLCDETQKKEVAQSINEFENKTDIKFELDYQKPAKKLKTFDCNKCDKSFELSVRLKKHMQNKHGQTQAAKDKKKSNDCPYCKKTFKFELILRRHIQFKCKKKKTSDKEFSCHFCEKAYVNFGDLHNHQKTEHKDGVKSESFVFNNKSLDKKSDGKGFQINPKTLGRMKSRVFKESVV